MPIKRIFTLPYHPSPLTPLSSPLTSHPSPLAPLSFPFTCIPSPLSLHPSLLTSHPLPLSPFPSPVSRHPSPLTLSLLPSPLTTLTQTLNSSFFTICCFIYELYELFSEESVDFSTYFNVNLNHRSRPK